MGGGATGKRLCLSCRLIVFFLKIEAFKRKLRVNHSSILLSVVYKRQNESCQPRYSNERPHLMIGRSRNLHEINAISSDAPSAPSVTSSS